MTKHTFGRKAIALGGAAAMLASMAACGSANSGDGGQDGDSASGGKTKITMWSWEPTMKQVVKDFNASQDKVEVELQNVGTAADQYTALNNAMEAGSGAPDIAQIEYYALPQYAIFGFLADLTDKVGGYEDFYTPGTWTQIHYGDKIYGMPMDSGPLATFYNKTIFDKAGVTEAPKTWDEFYEAAKKIHALGSNYYITNDGSDAGMFNALVWQAGGHPFGAKDKEVTINLTADEGVKTFTDLWQKMIDEDLINTKIKSWSDDWNRSLNDGTLASLVFGSWMPANLVNIAPDQAGNFRVALTPQWKEGDTSNSEIGGSSLAITSTSKKQDAAWEFLEYALHSKEGIKTRIDLGGFPSDNDTLNSDEFKNKTTLKNSDGEDVAFFGDQKYNEVLSQSAANVVKGYEVTPFEVHARTVYNDTVGKGIVGDISLADGLAKWQDELVKYGTDQGFTVKQ